MRTISNNRWRQMGTCGTSGLLWPKCWLHVYIHVSYRKTPIWNHIKSQEPSLLRTSLHCLAWIAPEKVNFVILDFPFGSSFPSNEKSDSTVAAEYLWTSLPGLRKTVGASGSYLQICPCPWQMHQSLFQQNPVNWSTEKGSAPTVSF